MKINSIAGVATTLLLCLNTGKVLAQSSPVDDLSELPKGLPAQLVDDLHSAFGQYKVRAVHAKGIILQGNFTPSSDAKTLSKAAVFAAPVPVIVRFSDFTGIPDIPDTSNGANPRGFAIKFLLPDGSNLDIVTHSFNGFPVSNASDFSLLLRAIGASGSGATKPTLLDNFLTTHPIAKTFLTTQKAPPESFATTAFFGVNAFLFTDASAQNHYVRYRFVPEAGEHYLDEVALKSKTPTYLADEISTRVTDKPVRFVWYAQLAEASDKIDDPALAWPENRQLIKLGVITIDRLGPNTAAADKGLLFLPGSLLPGIEIADPMVTVRNASYPFSFHKRQ